jgi:hypothetical protein
MPLQVEILPSLDDAPDGEVFPEKFGASVPHREESGNSMILFQAA